MAVPPWLGVRRKTGDAGLGWATSQTGNSSDSMARYEGHWEAAADMGPAPAGNDSFAWDCNTAAPIEDRPARAENTLAAAWIAGGHLEEDVQESSDRTVSAGSRTAAGVMTAWLASAGDGQKTSSKAGRELWGQRMRRALLMVLVRAQSHRAVTKAARWPRSSLV